MTMYAFHLSWGWALQTLNNVVLLRLVYIESSTQTCLLQELIHVCNVGLIMGSPYHRANPLLGTQLIAKQRVCSLKRGLHPFCRNTVNRQAEGVLTGERPSPLSEP